MRYTEITRTTHGGDLGLQPRLWMSLKEAAKIFWMRPHKKKQLYRDLLFWTEYKGVLLTGA